MDFRFTDEQTMTADVVRDLVADLCQPADLRRLMASGEPFDQNRWAKIQELGLQSALVAEEKGGLGLQPVDFVQVAEACGYACLPEPLVEAYGVAIPLLAETGSDAAAKVVEAALEGSALIAFGHPANPFVERADTADWLLIAKSGGLDLVKTSDAMCTLQPSIDPFRRLFSVQYDEAAALRIGAQSGIEGPIASAFDRGALFAAAQMLGIAQRCVDLAVDYAKERQQFGKPIGSYQALKHQLATVQVKIEFARPVLHAAAAMLPQANALSRARVSHAKLAACEAADLAARNAIQVHGAMGYSWEVDVHFFLKRAIALSEWWGGPAFHRRRVAERIFNGPLGPEHTFAKELEHA